MPSILVSLAAIFLCGGVVAGSFGPWFLIQSTHSTAERLARGYVTILIVCALLSLRFWVNSPFIVAFVTVALFFSAVFSTVLLIRNPVQHGNTSRSKTSDSSTFFKIAVALGVIYLTIDGIWAALPLYRYDQWTYHLVVSKWIDLLGALTPPVTYDHIFFTGTYELLGLIPRLIWPDDTFQQGFQNALSWSLVVIPGALLACSLIRSAPWRPLISVLFGGLLLFTTGDHEALVSAKPDYTLMMAAVLVLFNNSLTASSDTKIQPMTLGFLVVGMLTYKITWLHFAIAVTPFLFWNVWRTEKLPGLAKFIAGGTAAAVVVLPFLVKNWLIFHNPLHPAQSSVWHSTLWNPELTEYWRVVAGKPESIAQYGTMLIETLIRVPERAAWLLFVIGGAFLLNRGTPLRERWKKHFADFDPYMFFGPLALYILLWGAFYGPTIFNRFVSPLFAFGVVLILVQILNGVRSLHLAILMAMPIILNGQIEVSLKKIGDAATRTTAELHDHLAKSPAGNNIVLRFMAEHRKQHYPDAAYNQAILLSEYPFNFYGPSTFLIATDPVTLWHLTSRKVDPLEGCAKPLVDEMDIRYIWVHDEDTLKNWPASLRALISVAEKIQSFPGRGDLYHLPQITCDQLAAHPS